jgi:hypothetical protein
MKTNGTLIRIYFLLLLFALYGAAAISQPVYAFKNSVLVSGTDREVGAIYRFPNSKVGIDVLVQITALSPGITIATFDDNMNGGFNDAFQPRITAAGKTDGYAEFNFRFVLTGTSIQIPQIEIPATSIDVDGGGSLREFDEYLTPSPVLVDFDMIGTNLDIQFNGTSVLGKNKTGAEKDLIDTIAVEAMFTVKYLLASQFTARIGLENKGNNAATRQRSVYFAPFTYANSFLPISNLANFAGNRNNNDQATLNWQMRNGHDYVTAVVEKSENGTSFSAIGQVNMQEINSAIFLDNASKSTPAYYRLRMVDRGGRSSYSQVLYLKIQSTQNKTSLSVYPSVITDNANVNFASSNAGNAKITLYDLNGRLVLNKDVRTQEGMNTVAFMGLSRLSKGQYVVVVEEGANRSARQIQVH